MKPLALGIDIGGTKTSIGLVDASGHVLARIAAPTPARAGGERIVGNAIALARQLIAANHTNLAQGKLVAVGVGSAGVIDSASRRVVSATSHLTDWVGTDLGQMIEDALQLPVTTANDVHAHAIGEAFIGAGQGHATVLLVAVGTGIGGAVVAHGVLQTGAHGVAGHLGHIPVHEADGLPCPCGRTGHLEAVSSGTALHQMYLRNGGSTTATDARTVIVRAPTDPIAHTAIVCSAQVLGRALGGLVNVIDPDIIIIAGGMRNAGPLWWSSMNAGLRSQALPILENVHTTAATLGDDAANIGAAKRALDSLGIEE